MSKSSDIHQDTPISIEQFFGSRLNQISAHSQANYRKALAAFTAANTPDIIAAPTEDDIANWVIRMLAGATSLTTASHYLDIVAGLYTSATEAGVADIDPAIFTAIKARLKALRTADTKPFAPFEQQFLRLIELTRRARSLKATAALGTDLLLFSLATGAMPLADVARLRFPLPADGDGRFNESARDVALRNASPRRSYLFALSQSEYTPRRLAMRVDALVDSQLRFNDIPTAATTDATIRGWWAYAAIRCGIPPTDVAAHLGPEAPHSLPWLSLCRPAQRATLLSPEAIATVAETFAENRPRWFAMHLRARATYDHLTRAIAELPATVARPELFYPSDEIKRRIGRRLVTEQHPVIADIVFFRTYITDITPLFRHIGNLAWCYTVSGRSGSPYAAIHRSDMERFQQAIGQFTPDYEVGDKNSITPQPGDTVVVLGGIFAGRTGTMLENIPTTTGTIYRILMPGDNNAIEWRLTDPRLIGIKQ